MDIAKFTQEKWPEIEDCFDRRLNALDKPSLQNITIFVTGSFARQDAHLHSDLDFFISSNSEKTSRVSSIRLFWEIIKIIDELKIDSLSRDGAFLKIHPQKELLESIGTEKDDAENHFTARLLLLLESKPVFNTSLFNDIKKKVLQEYYRDYDGHERDFLPTFLLNDILRYWRTVCLNYEAGRKAKTEDKIKLTKLKVTRKLLCFSLIASLLNCEEFDQKTVIDLIQKTPKERLLAMNSPFSDKVLEVYQAYYNIMSKNSTSDLITNWNTLESDLTTITDNFGSSFYDLIISKQESKLFKFILL